MPTSRSGGTWQVLFSHLHGDVRVFSWWRTSAFFLAGVKLNLGSICEHCSALELDLHFRLKSMCSSCALQLHHLTCTGFQRKALLPDTSDRLRRQHTRALIVFWLALLCQSRGEPCIFSCFFAHKRTRTNTIAHRLSPPRVSPLPKCFRPERQFSESYIVCWCIITIPVNNWQVVPKSGCPYQC